MTTKIYRTAAKPIDGGVYLSRKSGNEDVAISDWTDMDRGRAEASLQNTEGWFLVEVLWDEENEEVVATF
jgi:hypothetical protein